MKSRVLSILVVVASLMLFQVAYAESTVEFGGDAEIDWTIEQHSNSTDEMSISPGSAALFGVTARTENEEGLYAEGYGEGNWETGGGVSAGDVYVEIGNPTFKFRVGNCGTEDIFGWGEDFYVADAGGPDRYDGGYVGDADMAIVTLNPSDQLTVQVATLLSDGEEDGVAVNEYGVRPAVILSSGNFTIGGGAEYLLASPQEKDANGNRTSLGFSGFGEVSMGDITIGGAGAMGKTGGKDFETDEDLDDVTVVHARGYVVFAFGEKYTFGAAGGYAKDNDTDDDTFFAYIAYYIKPFMVDNLRLQTGASFATATVEDVDESSFGGMIRFEYSY